MKKISLGSLIVLVVCFSACKKNSNTVADVQVAREVKFVFYTDKDFSGDNEDILFSVFIEDQSNNLIWDSAIAPMKVKEIPTQANSIVIDKTVQANLQSELRVGFRYTLPNVGDSWHIDTSSAGSVFKLVEYNFQ